MIALRRRSPRATSSCRPRRRWTTRLTSWRCAGPEFALWLSSEPVPRFGLVALERQLHNPIQHRWIREPALLPQPGEHPIYGESGHRVDLAYVDVLAVDKKVHPRETATTGQEEDLDR